MKKLFFLCAMFAACSAMFAQKYAVIDANSKLTEACRDSKNINYKMVEQAWADIQQCMTNEKSKDYYDTYRVAGKIKNILTYKIYTDGQASGSLDTLKYFNGLAELLALNSTYEKCMTTPNAKGKMPLDADDYAAAHKEVQATSAGIRLNILSGAYSILNGHPQDAMKLLDVYLGTFDDPLYKELKLNETDSLKENAYLYYGMALKNMSQTWEDTLKYLEWYEKVLPSPTYANYACVELMNTYKGHGDMAMWEKYCLYAAENFKEDAQFPKLMIQQYVNTDRKDQALALCDKMATTFPDEIFPVETKALMLFNDKKYNDAITVLKKLVAMDETYGRGWCSLGTCYYQLAMEVRDKVEECKKLLKEAVPCYKKAEEVEPSDPSLWGNFLYRCYHALQDKANEAKYKKYED